MDARRLRWEEWLAGLSGAVLFASLFLPWYRSEVNQVDYTAWQSFGSLDVLLAAVGLIGVALVIVTAVHPTAAVPIAMASLLALSGLLATALTISRLPFQKLMPTRRSAAPSGAIAAVRCGPPRSSTIAR